MLFVVLFVMLFVGMVCTKGGCVGDQQNRTYTGATVRKELVWAVVSATAKLRKSQATEEFPWSLVRTLVMERDVKQAVYAYTFCTICGMCITTNFKACERCFL